MPDFRADGALLDVRRFMEISLEQFSIKNKEKE